MTPVDVHDSDGQPLSGIVAADLAAESSGSLASSCAVLNDGRIKCWGRNDGGQLGDGTTDTAPVLVPVTVVDASGHAISNATDVAVGKNLFNFACALLSSRSVVCWGLNTSGQLGIGPTQTITASTHALTVVDTGGTSPLQGVAEIAAGAKHACARLESGSVKCWGTNTLGQLGNNSTDAYSAVPVSVNGLTGVIAVSAGANHTCALMSGGGVKCWGYHNGYLLGTASTTTSIPYPVDVSGLGSGVTAIATGANHTCALVAGGARCWGNNSENELGDNKTVATSSAPLTVIGLDAEATAIAAGNRHTCVVTSAGGVMCWGDDTSGQCGNGYQQGWLAPTDVVFDH